MVITSGWRSSGGRRPNRRRGRAPPGSERASGDRRYDERTERADENRGEALPTELLQAPGLLEIKPDGSGSLRFPENNYLPRESDVHVSARLIRHYKIRFGSMVMGTVQPPRAQDQNPTLVSITRINDKDPELHADEKLFKTLLPLDPEEKLVLEDPSNGEISMRVMDMLVPIGRGQRALIVAPPRTGKTLLMQKMCNAISSNHPELRLLVLLIDERPEEVTNFRRNTTAEVIASCFDEGTSSHVRVAELVLAKMKRSLEAGQEMVVFLDSITRLGRAYNNESEGSGHTLSGGMDAEAMAGPKAFFGSARNIDQGGSLTIVATALIDTASRLDQVIFEEFKGTGNCEVVLSLQLANDRIWPAIDIGASGTRKEEKLLLPNEVDRITALRRVLNRLEPNDAMGLLVKKLEATKGNAELVMQFAFEACA